MRDLASGFRLDKRPDVSLVAPPALRLGLRSADDDAKDAELAKPVGGHIFVLYLTDRTWAGDEGLALADEVGRYRYKYVYVYIYTYRGGGGGEGGRTRKKHRAR